MSHFDEKSGVIASHTEWGSWWQTMEEVYIEVLCAQPIRAKDVKCEIKNKHISLEVQGVSIFQGDLCEPVHADEALWTLEDKVRVHICLGKAHNTAAHCWPSLLKGQYLADPMTYDEMQKKLTLQRFQFENPGMDFSNATMSGNYQGGGPELPN